MFSHVSLLSNNSTKQEKKMHMQVIHKTLNKVSSPLKEKC